MVNFSKIISLCYPCSSKHHSIRDFERLKRRNQWAVGLITFVVSIATFPTFGMLGVLTFRCLVKKFSATPATQENLLGIKKIEKEALNCLALKKNPASAVKPFDSQTELQKQFEVHEKNQPQPKNANEEKPQPYQEVATKIPVQDEGIIKAQYNHHEVLEKENLLVVQDIPLRVEKAVKPQDEFDKHLKKELFDVIKNGKIDVVRHFLDNYGTEIANAEDENGNIPLHFAAANLNYEIVNLLLLHTKNLNAQDKKFSETALIRALKKEDDNIDLEALIKIVELLIKNGADVNIANHENYFPIHYVVMRPNLKLAKLVVPLTIDMNAQENRFQETPLHKLVWSVGKKGPEGLEIMKLFFQYGADANIEDHWKHLPLHSLWSFQEDIAELLISQTKNLNAQDKNGYTPLHFAAYVGPVEFAKLLLKYGADKTIKNNSHELPFHQAIIHKDEKMVELLLVKEEINAPTFQKQTALHLAAKKKPETLKLLIDNGADVNLVDTLNSLPLHEATANGCLENVKLLLPLTKDLRAKTAFEKTPLLLAKEKGHQEIVKILEEAEKALP